MDSYNVLEGILDLIRESGRTEKSVLQEAGISPNLLTEWKKGRIKNPSYDKIVKLAYVLNVSLDRMLTGKSSAADSTNVLSNDEMALINSYRKLSAVDQKEIHGIINLKLSVYPKGKSYTSKTGKSGPENPDDSSVTA